MQATNGEFEPPTTNYEPGATDIGEYLVSSRSLAEYRAMFALSDADLAGRILDCPGGAASFTAEVGDRVLAVDPVYAGDRRALAAHARAEIDRVQAWVQANPDRYVWDFYGSRADYVRTRAAGAQRFATDLLEHPHRYRAMSLPSLPLGDAEFDLALCSHLLFTYADRLGFDFHLAALIELARVAREVRVFPLVDLNGGRLDAMVEQLRGALAERGIATALRPVEFEFQRGVRTMLVVNV